MKKKLVLTLILIIFLMFMLFNSKNYKKDQGSVNIISPEGRKSIAHTVSRFLTIVSIPEPWSFL